MNLYSNKFNLDKLYTKPEIAAWCIQQIDFCRYEQVVEPSAGGGSFYNQIPHPNKIGFDIAPECDGVLSQDWLTTSTPLINRLVIGNPPFGIRNKLSIAFIQHAESLGAETIAFILPNVFNKHTLQNKISYSISEVFELPSNSFLFGVNDFSLPASFYIFEKNGPDTFRFAPSKYTFSPDFEFSTALNFDWFVMGAAPHNLKKLVEPNNRGYYIKCKISEQEVKQRFSQIDWKLKGNSSASGGVSWFTKAELIKVYNDHYYGELK